VLYFESPGSRVFAPRLRIRPVIRGSGQPAEASRLSGGRERVGFRLLVQRLGGQVDAIWPHDGARLGIELNLGKVGRIVKWFQDACPALRREVDITGRPVAKQQPEHVVADHGYACDDRKVALAHRHRLRQRRDAEHRLALARPFPVRHDLGPVQARPLLDEQERPVLKAASKHGAVGGNRGPSRTAARRAFSSTWAVTQRHAEDRSSSGPPPDGSSATGLCVATRRSPREVLPVRCSAMDGATSHTTGRAVCGR
jgi:hypothetical protein